MSDAVIRTDEQITARLTGNLTGIQDVLHEITPLRSRWNGNVTIDSEIGERANALFREDSSIVVMPRLIYRKILWRTLIHELVHSLGVPLSKEDYESDKGWEEGIVEYVQRRLRPIIMARLGIAYDEAFLRRIEPTWLYQPYVTAVETIIMATSADDLALCYDLLQQPIKIRPAYLIRRFKAQAFVISQQSAVLRTRIVSGTMSEEESAFWVEEE